LFICFVSAFGVQVSKALVIGAMATTEMMSKQLSEAVKDTSVGKKLASDEHNPRVDAAKTVSKATIGAVLHIYQAMETAVFGVAHDVSTATVTVVTHKYGEEAGAHTQATLGVAGEVAQAAHNTSQLGIKAIAKKTAIKTSQEVLTTQAERDAQAAAQQQEAAAAGPVSSIRAEVGRAMGLPAGMDPLVAMEAAQAVAQLSAASQGIMAQQHAHPQPSVPAAGAGGHIRASPSRDDVYVTTATATGATPAQAQAAAQAAANAGSKAAMAQPVVKK
jgi:hypothetical protein